MVRVRLVGLGRDGIDRWRRAPGSSLGHWPLAGSTAVVALGPAGEDPMTVRGRQGQHIVRFAPMVMLTKREAFAVCEVCADVERALLRAGRPVEAARAASLFELLESRLVAP